jgi:sugar lactone lactonase YvrE
MIREGKDSFYQSQRPHDGALNYCGAQDSHGPESPSAPDSLAVDAEGIFYWKNQRLWR